MCDVDVDGVIIGADMQVVTGHDDDAGVAGRVSTVDVFVDSNGACVVVVVIAVVGGCIVVVGVIAYDVDGYMFGAVVGVVKCCDDVVNRNIQWWQW